MEHGEAEGRRRCERVEEEEEEAEEGKVVEKEEQNDEPARQSALPLFTQLNT